MPFTLLMWALGVGLLQGFLHCVGMCGPFVLSFSLALTSESGTRTRFRLLSMLRMHLAHNLGRITVFVLLGIVFGSLGSFVNTAARTTGFQAAAGFIGGALMILWAIDEFRTGHGAGFLERWSILKYSPIQNLFRRITGNKGFFAAYVSGFILGFHPCGLIFAMLISAAATGSAHGGGLVMLLFGIGTVPSLLTVAMAGWYGRKRLTGRAFSYLAATLMAVSGVLFILRGLAVNDWIPSVNPWIF